MKKFLKKLIIVSVIMLIIMNLLDMMITNNLHQSKATMIKGMNEVYFDSSNYDVVVMGGSRALVQYDTRVLDSMLNVNSYNAGVNGRGVISQIIKYRVFEKRHGKPKIILQTIDCFALGEDNRFEREQYLPFFFDKELFGMIKEREGYSEAERIIPLIRYAGYEQMIMEGLGIPNKMPKSEMYKGYRPRNNSWDGKGLANVKEIGFTNHPNAYSLFNEYLNDCYNKGIIVVFVYTPLYYRAQQKINRNSMKEMYKVFESFSELYNIPILSWWDSPICNDTANFYNATHLNASGAKKFSEELAQSIDSLGLLKQN